MQSFFDQSRQDLLALVERPAKAARLFRDVYRHAAALPENVSSQLSAALPAIHQRFDSSDGTRRYLLKLADNQTIESVLIPREDRVTFCISSQIGCALACSFCLTGQLGLLRDLTAGEIVSQVMVLRDEAARVYPGLRFSIVLMGMGEPLQNVENVLKAIHILHDDNGLAIPPARITLSTAGLVPGIERLAKERVFPNLSISLTGATNDTRDRLMPINRKYPIEAVMDAVRRIPASRHDRVMFECVMIKGLTDTLEEARDLVRHLKGMRVKVNLIPLNPAPEVPFERSEDDQVFRYQQVLLDAGITTFIRKNRGNDVYGACGQLKKKDSSVATARPDSELPTLEQRRPL
jgi:23S rRNA (adenine2503-C2)-methyltransferase